MFNILEYVAVDSNNRAICPVCTRDKGDRFTKKNLSIRPDGAYHCHRCSNVYGKQQFTQELKLALGVPTDRRIPSALAKPASPAPIVKAQSANIQKAKSLGATVTVDQIREDHERLKQSKGKAIDWLGRRGITPQMIDYYQLGVMRFKRGSEQKTYWGITIPIAATDGNYFRKARIAPWLIGSDRPSEVEDWYQKGITAQVFFTWKPENATQTYLCEGEWDAILLGWQMRSHSLGSQIAVASFTSGCGTVPPATELQRLPGQVITFYDRNDKPGKDGKRPGEEGAKKVAWALGDRARIALVPQRVEHSDIPGWDVTDALLAGFTVADFVASAAKAKVAPLPEAPPNTTKGKMKSLANTVDLAPEYQEWLIPDLLTSNELFILAAPPRQGKSLVSLTLAHAVATGGKFLGRPTMKGKTIYINLEDSDVKVKERVIAQGWTREAMEEVLYLDEFKLSALHELEECIDEIDDLRLIIIDTLSRVRDDGYSEDKAEIGKLLEPLQNLARSKSVCVLVVHHTSKANVDNLDSVDVFSAIRGSGTIRSTARGAWLLASNPQGRGHRLFVENGWGKQDLRVYLDEDTLEWKAFGEWKPTVDKGQRERILEYIQVVQHTTVAQAAIDCGIAARSVGTILSTLLSENLLYVIPNTGRGNKPAIYAVTEAVVQLKRVEIELKQATQGIATDTGDLAQKSSPEQYGHRGHWRQQNVHDVQNVRDVHSYSNSPDNAHNAQQVSDSSFTSSFNSSQQPSVTSSSDIDTGYSAKKCLKVGDKCKAAHDKVYGVPKDKEVKIIKLEGETATVTYEGCRSNKGVDVHLSELIPL